MMYRFITAAMTRSRAVLTILAALLLGGLTSYISLPREADPDIPIPIIYVGVVLPGISPVDAERLLVKPMETKCALNCPMTPKSLMCASLMPVCFRSLWSI